MIKRISVRQLRLGMFLESFCGSWMEHPFWRSRFKLEDPADLARILQSPIQEVWIDTAKGLDVAQGGPSFTREQVDTVIDAQLSEISQLAELECELRPVAFEEEVKRAARICHQSRQAITAMFREVRMGREINQDEARSVVAEVSDSIIRNPSAMVSIARLKTSDDYTYMHSVAVCALMIVLARQLDLPPHQVRQAGYAGLLHDIGKMAIATSILNKPGRLTDQEFDEMREHPARGLELLKAGGVDDPVVLDVCLHHHEKVDGTGYPHRLRGEDISLFAKMGAVCDVYDAITSDRPYKRGWDPAEAVHKMAEWSAGHFDKTVFQAFVKSIGIYPVGSLVRLTTGRLGVVIDPGRQSLTCPQVKVFYSTASGMRMAPETVDLARPGCQEKIASREDPAKWGFTDLDALWKDPAWERAT
ncbi:MULTISPECIES: HD-GYP domain-containing protein [unclassified Delftia]|uniref:HD-GYP domain-containing protein n=1 Tax=unclassified Delftia TaxID=2613839 RepID=UPI000646DA6A|nr:MULTISPECIES: HD-GYP domain-containing protein [unclassified Delftia]MDC2862450.1 HD-GYP domain-containing protein [Delftia sp. DT-2]